jgi:hypothetical protein
MYIFFLYFLKKYIIKNKLSSNKYESCYFSLYSYWCCCMNPVPLCGNGSKQACSSIGLSWQESTFSSGCDIGDSSGPNYNKFYNACAQYNLHAKCY